MGCEIHERSCVRAGESRNSQKSCVRAEDCETTCVRELKSQRIRKIHVIRPSVTTQSCNQLLRIQLTMAEFLSRQERSQPSTPREPSEFEKMKHELTQIRFKPWCASCVKGKAQAEPHQRIERIVENSERTIVQCDYLVLKDTAASDGLKFWSMYVEPFGYGTSTVVEMKCLRHNFAMLSRTITHQVCRKCEANSHPKVSQTITSEQRISGKLSKKKSQGQVHTQCWQHFKTARNTDRPLTMHR